MYVKSLFKHFILISLVFHFQLYDNIKEDYKRTLKNKKEKIF